MPDAPGFNYAVSGGDGHTKCGFDLALLTFRYVGQQVHQNAAPRCGDEEARTLPNLYQSGTDA